MNDDQHSWTYELYDVVFCKETQEEKTVHASEKGRFMYKYCPELSRQNWTIDSILQHKVLTCYWSKKPEMLFNFSWEKVENLDIKALKNFGNLTA